MLLTQFYNSIESIDAEFRDPLQDLLRNEINSFNQFELFEKEMDPNIRFIYHLFFGTKHNKPIGFLQLILSPIEQNSGRFLFSNIFKHKQNDKSFVLEAKIPGINNVSYIFEPEYRDLGLKKIDEIINDLRNKRNIIAERWSHQDDNFYLKSEHFDFHQENKEIRSYIFNGCFPNYSEYFKNLKQEDQREIKRLWAQIIGNPNYNITEHDNLKSVFRNKSNAISKYNEIKKDPAIINSNGQETIYLTFEKNDEIIGIILISAGSSGHYFCHFFTGLSDDVIPTKVYLQYAIMRFLELDHKKYLHFSKNLIQKNNISDSELENMKIETVTIKSAFHANQKMDHSYFEDFFNSSRARIAS